MTKPEILSDYYWISHKSKIDIIESQDIAEIADEACEILCQCAYSWMKLFNDDRSAKKCLKKAMAAKNATISSDWRYVAWAYKAALDDDQNFLKYIEKAFYFDKVGCDEFDSRIRCIELLVNFGFSQKAVEYIDMTNPLTTSQNLKLLVLEKETGLSSDSKLRKRMEQAEASADDEKDFKDCITKRLEIFKESRSG